MKLNKVPLVPFFVNLKKNKSKLSHVFALSKESLKSTRT